MVDPNLVFLLNHVAGPVVAIIVVITALAKGYKWLHPERYEHDMDSVRHQVKSPFSDARTSVGRYFWGVPVELRQTPVVAVGADPTAALEAPEQKPQGVIGDLLASPADYNTSDFAQFNEE